MIGRSEQIDIPNGISSTYSCMNCCPDSFYAGWVDPGGWEGFVGGSTLMIASEQDRNCYGYTGPPYNPGPGWDNTFPSICSTDSGTTTGEGQGEGNVQAIWTAYEWGDWESGGAGECNSREQNIIAEAICDVLDCLCVGTPLTDAEWNFLSSSAQFPNLQRCQSRKQAAATGTYNCLAWTIDDTSQWWWLEADTNGNGKLSSSELDAFYSARGKSNIAYYGPGTSDVLHVAKKAGGGGPGCLASSKLGSNIRMAHHLPQLEGGAYSNIVGGN
jgi:hypothetical protein